MFGEDVGGRGRQVWSSRIAAAVLLASSIGVPAAASLRVAPSSAQWPVNGKVLPFPGNSLQARLGRLIFFDTTLSNPAGQACSSCHAPEAGFKFPDSRINDVYGVATGALPRRFGNRAVPTISYAAYIPEGPPVAHIGNDLMRRPASELLFIGGLFWDGRAHDLENQATFPFQNPNEMNNLVHNVGSPDLVVEKVRNGTYADAFRRVYGANAFNRPTHAVFADIVMAIAAYERTSEVSPFSSKYDAYIAGQVQLTPEEMDGLRLMTGTWNGKTLGPPYHKNAQCIMCHGIEDDPSIGPSLWTFFCYSNIGVPKNPNNPFYSQTDSATNPVGYNPLGPAYLDFGLGGFLYPLNGLPIGNRGPGADGHGDYLAVNGTFKAPTLRNVDKRPYPGFVKAYMHNGVFKDLKDVVHFYNTRNLTTVPGEIIDFTQPDPYANLQGVPLWPPPEAPFPSSLLNPTGDRGSGGGQVGNLNLTDEEEDHIVAFLKTLSDGYDAYGH